MWYTHGVIVLHAGRMANEHRFRTLTGRSTFCSFLYGNEKESCEEVCQEGRAKAQGRQEGCPQASKEGRKEALNAFLTP